MVLSFVPEPTLVRCRAADGSRRRTRPGRIVDEMEGSHRLLLHGRVNPNFRTATSSPMERAGGALRGVAAWKTYTQFGTRTAAVSTCLDEDSVGIPFIERAQGPRRQGDLHPQGHTASAGTVLRTQPAAATSVWSRRRFPDVRFHHLPLRLRDRDVPKAPTRPRARCDGIDTLVHSVRAHRQRRRTQQQCLRRARQHLALPDAGSGARPPTVSASCSRRCGEGQRAYGVRIRSGTARPRTRSRPSAPSRSTRGSGSSTATPPSRPRRGPASSV